jgi:uncharacterized membrane protein YjjP (DUF1212 family)
MLKKERTNAVNSVDYELINVYDVLFQQIQMMDDYLDEYEKTLHQIENPNLKLQATKEFEMVDAFVQTTAKLMRIVVQYRALNPHGTENQDLKDQLWKAKQYVQKLGGDWNTILWTKKSDY